MSVSARFGLKAQSYFYGGAAVLFWSIGAYLLCLLGHLPFLQVMGIGLTIGGCVSLFVERKQCSLPAIKRHLVTGWVGIALLLVNQVTYVLAFRMAPEAHVDLINYLWPSLLVIGEAVRTRRTLSATKIIGLLACLVALVVLVAPALNLGEGGFHYVWGYLVALMAALSWATYSLWTKSKSESEGRENLVGVQILVVGALAMAIQCFIGGFVAMSLTDLLLIAAFGAGVSGLAFPCWQRALKFGSCTSIGGMANAIPVLSVGWLIVGGVSELSTSLVVAGFLVLLGCYLLNRSKTSRTVALLSDIEASELAA